MKTRFSSPSGIALAITLLCLGGNVPAETPAAAAAFKNSLGLRFTAVEGTPILFSIWETRVQDYRAFTGSTGRSWKSAGFSQSSSHPVVMVSWEDATQFCRWLTKREIEAGTLTEGCRYRLPSSAEWSLAVGLPKPAANDTLSLTNGPSQTEFPWGGEWPPDDKSGNYHPELGCDNYSYTSPVGSFASNRFGLYDMGGNVWEWCSDSYKNSIDFRVLRGASWRMRSPGDLLSSLEIGNVGHLQLNTYGFRVVLELGEGTTAQELTSQEAE